MDLRTKPVELVRIDDSNLREHIRMLGRAVLSPNRGGEGAPSREPESSTQTLAAEVPARRNKPPRYGIQFKLPEIVAKEFKLRAAQQGTTATLILMEILRRDGWPITDADFIDLRREPR